MSDSFTDRLDLVSARLGGRVLSANDEFFAEKENLLKDEAPIFIEGKFTDRGKWMDGWETRRRRDPGHDWCIIELGVPGVIHGVDADTRHFRGNHPTACSIEGWNGAGAPPADAEWVEVVPRTELVGHASNPVAVTDPHIYSHIRFNIYPDGGVARLRVYGDPVQPLPVGTTVNLAAAELGACVEGASDSFFASRHNLILPGDSLNMGDGWESKRRSPGTDDWVVIRLACPGTIQSAVVDTSFFKGNYPASCSLEGCMGNPATASFEPIFDETPLQPHHKLQVDTKGSGPHSHVRFHIYPDGGVARLRLNGTVDARHAEALGLRWLNALPESAARAQFLNCCGSQAWASRMAAERSWDSLEAMKTKGREIWASLSVDDHLEAFAAHPRIGESSEKRFSAAEQSGTRSASQATLDELAQLNKKYDEKFGFVFLICATGKSADEMLAALNERIEHDRDTEIAAASQEQALISDLRLEKLLTP